jgi:hypothetical protein
LAWAAPSLVPDIRRKTRRPIFAFLGLCEVIDPILLLNQRDHFAQVPIFTEHRFAAKSMGAILSDAR